MILFINRLAADIGRMSEWWERQDFNDGRLTGVKHTFRSFPR